MFNWLCANCAPFYLSTLSTSMCSPLLSAGTLLSVFVFHTGSVQVFFFFVSLKEQSAALCGGAVVRSAGVYSSQTRILYNTPQIKIKL